MQIKLAVRLLNNRLTFSTGFSILLHLLVFFLLSFLLHFTAKQPNEKVETTLVVRLALPYPPLAQPKFIKKLLTTSAPAEYKVAQAPVHIPPVTIPEPTSSVADQTPADTGEVSGIALPTAVATPFQGQARTSNPFSLHAQSAQQQAARTYYQQAMDAQARQRSEYQSQIMMQQLQQLLSKTLEQHPSVTGKCVLAEPAVGASSGLKCDSSALYEAFYKDQQSVARMLIALREMGRIFNGFSVNTSIDFPKITLINNELMEAGTKIIPSPSAP